MTVKQLIKIFMRVLELLTGFHKIHSIKYSYGYKIPFTNFGIFYKYGIQKLGTFKSNNGQHKDYHNCTLTNIY